MFIQELYDSDVRRIREESGPLYREANIAWASEGMASLGPINVGTCQRAFFYKALGVPQLNPTSVKGRRIMDIGLMAEDHTINKFKENNKHVAEQERVQFVMPNTQNEVMLSGKIDEIIKDEGVKKGLEIKTIDTYKVATIFGIGYGNQPKLALPAPVNLIQAMMYKYKAKNGGIGEHEVQEIYLMYICRSDYTNMYFHIDIDDAGFPIITPITMQGQKYSTLRLQEMATYDQLLDAHYTTVTSDQSRLAELRINIYDVFKKFDTTYSYIREGVLPQKDYSLTYTDEQAEKLFRLGRITQQKFDSHRGRSSKTGKSVRQERLGDWQCKFCQYRNKCLEDDGIRLR